MLSLAEFSKVIGKDKVLESLDLSDCDIREGYKEFFNSLKSNRTLTKLDLRGRDWGDFA